MLLHRLLHDSPEYTARAQRAPQLPPPPVPVPLAELRAAVPTRLFMRSTLWSLAYIARHVACTYAIYALGTRIGWLNDALGLKAGGACAGRWALVGGLWTIYWGVQGLAFAGVWCLGHEAGHHALSDCAAANTALGVLAHTFVLTPYYAWRITRAMHHKATNDLDRDETYIPPLRSALPFAVAGAHALEETPAATLLKLCIRQFFGFQLYLLHNRKGNPRYPPGTSHYLPSSNLFKPRHYNSVLASNACIGAMLLLLLAYARARGWAALCAHYVLPWLWAHNWIVLFTYLQHSDPTIPYYRKGEWTFARGALATVDRPLFGWAGRFFMHNISTDHVAHHFFPTIPFYNLPEATKAIRPVLGEHYAYDSTPALYALYRSFTRCVYVEPVDAALTHEPEGADRPAGDVLFFRDRRGAPAVGSVGAAAG